MRCGSTPVGGIFPCLKVVSVSSSANRTMSLITPIESTGRSLNSCKMAFYNMQQQRSHLPTPTAPIPRPDVTGTPASIDPTLRKRPLYPDKPLAPRAIQPRPPASAASYSSESSAQLSPGLDTTTAGEPPRKRGRPSKAETERRKAAAEARGETYPPPRRSGSGRLKIPPSPTSPPAGTPIAPYQPSGHLQPAQPHHPASMQYEVAATRPAAPTTGFAGADERRDMPSRGMGPGMRDLPRPQEMGHPLPSPQALQLGPPDSFRPRLNSNPNERASYSAIPPDRFSPPDSGRRDSVTSRGEPPLGSYEGRTSTTPGEKATR